MNSASFRAGVMTTYWSGIISVTLENSAETNQGRIRPSPICILSAGEFGFSLGAPLQELGDQIDHVSRLLVGEFRIDRDRERFSSGPLALRESAFLHT